MNSLPPDSYTARRLEHATPVHLHETTRRTFIGPIPRGWLDSHRKKWYKDYVGTSRRAPTFTAAEINDTNVASQAAAPNDTTDQTPRPSSQTDVQSSPRNSEPATSLTSLLHNGHGTTSAHARSREAHHTSDSGNPQTARDAQSTAAARERAGTLERMATRLQGPRVRFSEATSLQLRTRAQRLAAGGTFRRTKIKPGELLKMEKMLVRIDFTRQVLGNEYDERASQSVETRAVDKWREFVVVCRKHEDGAVLQLYQTRVISQSAEKTKRRPKAQLLLSEKGGGAKVNMYSTLDKTLCVWHLDKAITYIYYLRPSCGAASVEWLSFLRGVLGEERNSLLRINVPDLNVSLQLDDPFRTQELSATLVKAAEGNEEALAKVVLDETGAAGAIVTRCIEMLKQSPQWAEVLDAWSEHKRIGLAWKRYDRLEWVHGAAEQKMYGTVAMQRTHDLELRPKEHYPVTVKTPKGKTRSEPPPVEGFLIRLTSQRGHERRMGRMLFKRLYFATFDHYIVFLQPSKASPPPPPKSQISQRQDVPTTQQISDKLPLTYDVNPYPLENGQIAWMDAEGIRNKRDLMASDREAMSESERVTRMLMACDGFINMREIKRVRDFRKGATPADDDIDSDGTDVDFDEPIVDRRIDGQTTSVGADRIFELLMQNGLVVRLQAYDAAAKHEWLTRLRALVKYWRLRSNADIDLFKAVREQNLQTLQIDERAEAQVGSFAYKWEVSQSYADPALYNLCGISSCRTIHLSGLLHRRPRRHTTFTRCHVILTAGHLLIFEDALRRRTGKQLAHSHHERIASVDLRGCYLYSGLLTENDLLYQNQTFDSNMPGHHALPRVYLEDAWTSTDEDAMTTFAIWHAKSKSWFRSSQFVDDARRSERDMFLAERANTSESLRVASAAKTKTKLQRVSKLGVAGRSVLFKARSRAERDHWVLAIQVAIGRLAAMNDEVRLEGAS